MANFKLRYGSITFFMVLSISFLAVLDAYFTIYLVSRGAREINPIMAFYLTRGSLVFFCVKYFLTAASLFLALSTLELFTKKAEILSSCFFAVSVVLLALVVQWELYLIMTH